MHSRNYNSYNYNTGSCDKCTNCNKPEPVCACKPPKSSYTDLKIRVFDCKYPSYFNKGECAAFKIEDCNGGYYEYYKSNRDANNIPPNHPPTDPNDPYWLGPFDICDIFDKSGAQGPMGAQGPQGQKGDQGSIGPTGTQGSKGDKGDKGDVGDIGPKGDQGNIGDTGPKGDVGDIGPKGDTGPAGSTGAQGATGATGPTGERGQTGLTGDTGLTGPQGPAGERGIQGITGETGAQGAQGNKGDNGLPYNPDQIVDVLPEDFECPPTGTSSIYEASTGLLHFCIDGVRQPPIEFGRGEKGETGAQGPAGVRGDVGPQGAIGDVGPQGPRGERGDVGPIGPRGDKGDTGATGAQGPRGDTGATGERGQTGLTGPQGLTGAKGDTGERGQTGLTGPQGPIGPQGPAGVQGPAGEKGEKGDIGPIGPQGPAGGPQGPQGPMSNITIGQNGNWFVNGQDTGQKAQGPEGKPYDPNCQAAVVVDIICANKKGNITLVFEEVDGVQDTQEMPVSAFKPTGQDILNAVEHTSETGDKYWTTTNRIKSNITWYSKPVLGLMFILSDFRAGEMTDFNKQAIRFDVIDANGGCLGYGYWELLVECDNCNCVIPTIHVETDATGKECAIWNDGKGNLVKLATCNSSACGTIDQYPDCDPLLAKHWKACNEGVEIGYYTYNNAYWLNSICNNDSPPDSMEGWHGPFGTYELIQHHIETVINERVAIIVNNILRKKV